MYDFHQVDCKASPEPDSSHTTEDGHFSEMSEQIYYPAWYYNPENYHVVKPAVKA